MANFKIPEKPPVQGKYGTGTKTAGAAQHHGHVAHGHTTAGVVTHHGHYQSARAAISRPTDTKDYNKFSVLLMRQSWLDQISAICEPPAGDSEFQVHYRALVVRIKQGGAEAIISVPTYFYNFTQTVTSGSVHYHLNDLEAEAAKGDTIVPLKINEILEKMPFLAGIKAVFPDAEVSYQEVNSGSLHRHPGRFGFSSIDYDKDPTNPGVIYREAECVDKVHTDSVIYLGKNTEIYTTETRILNLKQVGQGVEGTYCQIPTLTYILKDTAPVEESSTKVEAVDLVKALLMGYTDETTVEVTDNSKDFLSISSMGATKKTFTIINEVLMDFLSCDYRVNMDNVLATRITPRFQTYKHTGYGKPVTYGSSGKKAHKTSWGNDFYDYDDDGWGDAYSYGVNIPTKKSVATHTHKADTESKTLNPYPVGSAAWKNWYK